MGWLAGSVTYPVAFEHRRIEIALDVVYPLRYELKSEECIAIEIVQKAVGGRVPVLRFRVGRRGLEVDTILLPFLDVLVRNASEIDSICRMPSSVGDLGHGFDTHNTFECQIGIVLDLQWQINVSMDSPILPTIDALHYLS